MTFDLQSPIVWPAQGGSCLSYVTGYRPCLGLIGCQIVRRLTLMLLYCQGRGREMPGRIDTEHTLQS